MEEDSNLKRRIWFEYTLLSPRSTSIDYRMEEDGLLLFSLLRLSALGLAVYYCVNGLSGVWRWMLATWRIITAMNKLPSPPKHWLYGHLKQV